MSWPILTCEVTAVSHQVIGTDQHSDLAEKLPVVRMPLTSTVPVARLPDLQEGADLKPKEVLVAPINKTGANHAPQKLQDGMPPYPQMSGPHPPPTSQRR